MTWYESFTRSEVRPLNEKGVLLAVEGELIRRGSLECGENPPESQSINMKGITTDPIMTNISLTSDNETVTIHELQFRSRPIHRQLSSVDEVDQHRVLLDILEVATTAI